MSTLALVDISTKKVHVFPLKGGGKGLTIKDFMTAVEEVLTSAQGEQEGTCVRVLCAAVGEYCINICDRSRTVLYHLLDARPWLISTGVFSSKQVDVHIRDTTMENGNEVAIKLDFDRTCVKDLKQKFAKMTCTLFPSLRFIYEKKELENDRRMSDYNLTNGSVVSCLCTSARNRTANFATPHVYISPYRDQNGVYNGLSPVWRRATPGLWLEGECRNKICVAFSRLVIMNQGFSDLDFISERHACKCPMCYEAVVPVAFGFNRCKWMTAGVKAASEVHCPHVERQNWQRLEEGYRCFAPRKDDWSVFKICCRELSRLEFCAVCMTRSLPRTMRTAPCGHAFHSTCVTEEGASLEDCLQCAAEQSMTSYQNCF